jgi:glycogen debranching enzyme
MDPKDGLLAAGEPGVQLTWMDARVGDRVITPRVGKPVEIQALWINALWIASQLGGPSQAHYERALRSFQQKFWNGPAGVGRAGFLFDVVDVNHVPGKNDASLRPNQVFAVGGLPLAVLEGEQARSVVEVVEARLLTPIGLRSLAPGETAYAPRYEGGPAHRDAVYHQGTVWPWLIGSFVEAWVRVKGDTQQTRRGARERFLTPLLNHLHEAGLGHISEIADAEPPHQPHGCPFQAWSLGELIRLDKTVLNVDTDRQEAEPRDHVVEARKAGARQPSRSTS